MALNKSVPVRWQVLEDRFYDQYHQWSQVEDAVITMGVTDYVQDSAGDILYVSLPKPGTELKAGEPWGSLESGKWVGQLYAPFDGVVIAANEAVEEAPGVVNQDPYHKGWLIKVKPAVPAGFAVSRLMGPERYRAMLAELETEEL
ncbi:Glycine cleavage system H protein [Candidatus Hydrogenisulfobacillus filiaventi]|uniref:Glycine cleavage system H protein n=1 Tax=Candidatus Hydrogenisulfobacillus filiaventi TaxID=2707344 RepID=A0A6F8ZJR6_9FIRM|nr:glycine cleavage system protein H [Bacillota bacterium]CAB1129840.1 Glycine cleavage system H protein [Candidatus Hydrogenisulfobacillus filiaventi]